jgi:hypothetical protein
VVLKIGGAFMLFFGQLVLGWSLFVIAVVQVAREGIDYYCSTPEEFKEDRLWLLPRIIYTGACFAGWQMLIHP